MIIFLLLTVSVAEVNIFMGTKGTGHTFPGAVTPFGMVQLSPDNGKTGWPYCSGYQHGTPITRVSHIHLSGTGIGDGLDIGFKFTPFTPTEEGGYQGFYYAKSGDKYLNLTTDGQCGFIRYGGINLELDLKSNFNWDKTQDYKVNPDGTGYRKSRGWGDNTIYFNHTKSDSEIVTCISHVEYPTMTSNNFDQALEIAQTSWSQHLNQLEGIPILETSLYHTLIHPSQYKGQHSYTIFSTWDTYRSWNSLMTLLYPQYVQDWTSSMLELEYIPVWEIWGKDSLTMSGNHGLSLIGEYVLKGLIDPNLVWDKMIHTLTRNNRYFDQYYSLGYITSQASKVSGSMNLEHCYTDYVISTIQTKYNLSSNIVVNPKSYLNIFSEDMFYPKDQKGIFNKKRNNLVNNGFDEGSALTYQFSVLHDFEGLIRLHQNLNQEICSDIYPCTSKVNGNFKNRLDLWFQTDGICGQLQDLTDCIGQYTQSNEPTHHVPYLYTVIGYPEITCKLVRQAGKFFSNTPEGIPGNEDAGAMSSWLIFAAMGMYPVNPASGIYILGCPIYPEPLRVGKVNITRSGSGDYPTYYWNNVKLSQYFLTHQQLLEGGDFHVVLSKN